MYAGYFASNAVGNRKKDIWGIVEVDTDKLNLDLMRPDEDMIAQAERINSEKKGTKIDLFKRTLHWRERLDINKHLWLKSLEAMGTCSHKGTIPAEAVTRVSLFDANKNPKMAVATCEPFISIMNFMLCRPRYELLTRWLMGEKVTYEEWAEANFITQFKDKMAEEFHKDIQLDVEPILAKQDGILVYRRNEVTKELQVASIK